MQPEALIDKVRGWVAAAERVVVRTGAGISTESGFQRARTVLILVFSVLLLLFGLMGLAAQFLSLVFGGAVDVLPTLFCVLAIYVGYRGASYARRKLRAAGPTNRMRKWLVWSLLVLGLTVPPGWYWNYRMSMHREAPAYFDKFLVTLGARWALDDIAPFFSERLLEASSRTTWEPRLLCYAQLGRLKSHGRPVTSDLGLLGRVLYLIPARFEEGEATVYVAIDKIRGEIRVDGLYVGAGGSKFLNDHSWCQSFRTTQMSSSIGPGRM